jgi:ATP-dependent RNA helicase DDX3X
MSDAGGTPTVNGAANGAAEARAQQMAEDLKRAQEAGWNNPIPFNYETVVGGEADAPSAPAGAGWLSDAAVYEWTDEYGTVGGKNEKLERELFEDPDMQRAGTRISLLETFDVTVEGKEKVQPVRSVS